MRPKNIPGRSNSEGKQLLEGTSLTHSEKANGVGVTTTREK